LESLEHVIAILLLAESHNALFTILLDFTTQEALELPAVTEIKVLAHSSIEIIVLDFVTTRRQAIIHMNTQKNLGNIPVFILDILDKRDSIVVYVEKSIVEQSFHKHLIPAMSSLLQTIDEASALQHLVFRQSVFARQVNIDSFLAFG